MPAWRACGAEGWLPARPLWFCKPSSACALPLQSAQQARQPFGGKAAGEDEAAQLWASWAAIRQAASQPELPPEWVMRQALFASQARLLLKLHRHSEVRRGRGRLGRVPAWPRREPCPREPAHPAPPPPPTPPPTPQSFTPPTPGEPTRWPSQPLCLPTTPCSGISVHPCQVADRGLAFVRSFGGLLAQQQRAGELPPQLREAWAFASYLSLAEATSRLQATWAEEKRRTDALGRGAGR